MMYQQSRVETVVCRQELSMIRLVLSYLLEELYLWAEQDGSILSDEI